LKGKLKQHHKYYIVGAYINFLNIKHITNGVDHERQSITGGINLAAYLGINS